MSGRALRAACLPTAPQAAQGLHRFVFALLLSGVLLRMNLSANMLACAGIPYAQDGGNPLVKLHPGTLLIAAALLGDMAGAWLGGRSWLRAQAVPHLVFLAMMLACVAEMLASIGMSGVAALVDSYLCAGFVAVLMRQASSRQCRTLARAVLAALLVNVAIALGETALHRNLYPDMSDLIEKLQANDAEFRGMALFDHPLNGAMLTMTGVFLVLGTGLRGVTRAGLLAWLALGLLAFGGRAALAVTCVTLGGLGTLHVLRRAATRRLGVQLVALSLAAVFVAPLAAWVVLTETPFAQRILTHLAYDDSAAVRDVQWQALAMIDARQALLGSSIDQVRQITFSLSQIVPFTDIENFWLATFLTIGAIGFAFFLSGMLPFLRSLWSAAPFWGRTMLVCGLVVASASNTLARKSDLLVLLVACVAATGGFVQAPVARPPRVRPVTLRAGRQELVA